MKIRILALLFIIGIIASGCGSTLRFDQTCITCIKSQRLSCSGDECPSTFMIGNDCLVTMTETGENIYLNKILTEEKITPKEGIPIAIALLNGNFYLTGDNFNNLWIITPKGGNGAGYDYLELPQKKIMSPVFELFSNKLLLSAENYTGKYLLEGDKWISQDQRKGD